MSSNNEEFLNSQPLVPNSLHSSGITELALRNLTGSLHRSAIAVAAVMMAFSMMLGASVMIDSFRSTVNYWINQSVKADVYLTPASNLIHGGSEALSDSVAHEIPQIKGVSDYDTYHEAWLDFSDTPAPSPQSSVLSPPSPDPHTVKLAAIDFRVMQRHPHLTFKGRRFTDFLKLCKENRVLVNESFATRFGKNTGDSISLRTPSGKTEFRIEGIFYDYSTDSGRVLMDQSRYSILWKDQRTYSYALYLDGSRPAHDVKREIEQRFGKEARLAIFLNQELRSEVLRVFDQTFAITLSLRAITVAVAALTLFLTLTTLIAERERELGILRSLGVQSTTLLRMVMTEAFALGVVGWFMGCVGGLGISWLLAFVINKAYFGWTIQWRLDPSLFVAAFFLAMPAALFAGFFSGLRAIKTPIHEALRYE